MRKIEEVLRLKYAKKQTHRAIAKSCGLSPSTVSEYVKHAKAAGVSWPLPEGITEEELKKKLFPEKEEGNGTQKAEPEWKEVHKEMRRKSVTLSLLWMEYREANPTGYGYSQYCERYRRWRKRLKQPTMRQKHVAGEKLYVDYAGQTMGVTNPETGEMEQMQLFVGVLGASSYTYAEAHRSQSLENWIGAHVRMLNFLGGVPEIIVPDNLKAGVKSPNRYEPDINPSYQELARHYGVAIVPARVRKPKDKAKAEVGVQVVERWIAARLRDAQFFSVNALNDAIKPLLEELNKRPMQHVEASRQELFEQLDKPALSPLPQQRYEFAHWKMARVHIDYHVVYDKHYYSVPFQLAGKQVDIRATENGIEVFVGRQRVASHPRLRGKVRYATLSEHMPVAHQQYAAWSAERFLTWANTIGPHTAQLVAAILDGRHHPQQAYRTCLGILGLGKRYSNQRLEAACRRALTSGIRSYKGIRNILDHKLDTLPHDPPSEQVTPTHQNIRGQAYFH